LLRVARKVVWYDAAERTLDDIPTFLAHLMVYGSPADVKLVEQYISPEEFRKAVGGCARGNIYARCLDRMAQESRYAANSAITAAPVSRRQLGTGSRAILRAIDFLLCVSQRDDEVSWSDDCAQDR